MRFLILALLAVGLVLNSMPPEAYAQQAKLPDLTSKINNIVSLGGNKHLVKFTICSLDKKISEPTILIKSDTEVKEIKYKKILMPKTCKNYNEVISAKWASSIILFHL